MYYKYTITYKYKYTIHKNLNQFFFSQKYKSENISKISNLKLFCKISNLKIFFEISNLIFKISNPKIFSKYQIWKYFSKSQIWKYFSKSENIISFFFFCHRSEKMYFCKFEGTLFWVIIYVKSFKISCSIIKYRWHVHVTKTNGM